MTRNKGLWRRLQCLEAEYRALTLETPDYETDRLACLSVLDNAYLPQRMTSMHKEIRALRTRFGIHEMPAPPITLYRPQMVVHRLPPGKIHPVSPQEVQQTLAELPLRDLEGLRAVILTDSRRDRHACYGRRRIKLCYPVDTDYRVRLRRNEGWWEVCQFGAWIEVIDGARYACWEPDDLKNYVLRHLLLHEVGHHVALLRGCGYAVVSTRREEEFAESYAHAYFDPGLLK